MDRVITLLVSMIVAVCLGLGMDRLPPIGWHKFGIGFDLPDSLMVQRDKAAAKAAALEAAIAAQNASLSALKADGDARAAQLDKALHSARPRAAAANRRATEIAGFKPTGSDVCAQLLSVDAEVVRARR